MKPRTKRILNYALIIGTLIIVLVISFQSHDLPSVMESLSAMDLSNALLCAACLLGYVAAEALSIRFFLRRQGYRISLGYALYIAILGQYYSDITPGASGGQPMQVFYLHKRNIPTGVATSALLVRFFCFKVMITVLTTAFWVTHAEFVRETLGRSMWILIVGYVYNLFSTALIILFSFFRPLVRGIANLLIRIGAKTRLMKKPEETRQKWSRTIDLFHESMQDAFRRPADLMVELFLGGAQLFSLMCIIWFVYRGLKLEGADFGQMLTLHLLEYISAAYTPLPGASGAQEFVFDQYLGKFFPGASAVAALLLWRFFTYYFSMILGAVVVTIGGLRSGKSLREVAEMGDIVMGDRAAQEQPAAENAENAANAENTQGIQPPD